MTYLYYAVIFYYCLPFWVLLYIADAFFKAKSDSKTYIGLLMWVIIPYGVVLMYVVFIVSRTVKNICNIIADYDPKKGE